MSCLHLLVNLLQNRTRRWKRFALGPYGFLAHRTLGRNDQNKFAVLQTLMRLIMTVLILESKNRTKMSAVPTRT